MSQIKNNQNKTEKLFEKLLKDKKVRVAVTTKSFEWFFLFYFREHIKCESAPFHEEFFKIAEDDSIKLAVVVAFRDSAKSTILSTAYTIWSVLGVQQKKFVILSGQTEENARQSLLNIKEELENNELLRNDLGPFEEERNQWGSTALVIKRFNAKIMIRSIGQHIRGLKHHHYRPSLIILDDIEDTTSVKTQEGRDKTFEWVTNEAMPAGDTGARIIAIGNLLHEDSLLKRFQKQIENGERTGIYREYPLIDENGNSLWPGKYPDKESVEAKRKWLGDPIAWAREYLLKIISSDQQLIQPEWVKFYDGDPPPLMFHGYRAIGVDLAISKSATADYTAMVPACIVGRGKDLKIYILPAVVNEKLTSLETIQKLQDVDRRIGRCKMLIEDVQYQSSLTEHLRSLNYNAINVKVHGQDKYARLGAVSFLVQDGKVLFPRNGGKIIEILINQLTGFGIEKHDDLVDGFSILLAYVIEKDRGSGVSAGMLPRPKWRDKPLPEIKNRMFPASNRPYADLDS